MAQPVTLTSWSAEHVRVADVLGALESLRAPEAMPPTRTSVLTLVILAASRDACRDAMSALYELGGRHPARVLTLLVPHDEANETRIDADVRLLGGEAEGQALWFEEVELGVHGPVADHLDSLIEPFTLPDLPVVVWYVEQLPVLSDPLLHAADAAIVDGRIFGNTECFSTILQLTRRIPVVDLSWHRLRPWRELLGGLFESPDTRPFADGITVAGVTGRTGPSHLLAGWIADRLHLPLDAVTVDRAEHVSIVLTGHDERGRSGTFEVIRHTDDRVVCARARVEGGPKPEAIVPLPPSTPGWGVAEALSHIERDRIYERALRVAIMLSARTA